MSYSHKANTTGIDPTHGVQKTIHNNNAKEKCYTVDFCPSFISPFPAWP
jgi:hypothetical protein